MMTATEAITAPTLRTKPTFTPGHSGKTPVSMNVPVRNAVTPTPNKTPVQYAFNMESRFPV